MSVKWGHTTNDASSAITMAIMEAIDRTLRATRPTEPTAAAIAGLLGAVLAFLVRDRGAAASRELPGLAREAADHLVRASLVLARALADDSRRQTH